MDWDVVLGVLREYGPGVGLGVTWAGIGWAWWRRRGEWKRKSFLKQVNFSLNDLREEADGSVTLVLRTLLEDEAQRVWLNDHGVKLVLRAAERASVERPFLGLPRGEDTAYVLRAVLNVLSERFAEAHLARAVGLPVRTEEFVFGLTCEKYGAIRTRKLRVMIARREVLERLFGGEGGGLAGRGMVRFAAPSHADRLDTLREMHRLLRSERGKERAMLDVAELGVATASGSAAPATGRGATTGRSERAAAVAV